jgi:hypothetical protein
MDLSTCIVLTGAGATLVMDAWVLLRRRLFGVRALDYALVGRWLVQLARSGSGLRTEHSPPRAPEPQAAGAMRVLNPVAAAPPVRGERVLGWIVHYAIGIAFAGVLVAVAGPVWCRAPSLAPALLVGIGSVAAPFLVLQPAFGMGLAARRTASPWRARAQTLVTHAVFGLGLHLSGSAAALLRVG